MLEQSGIAHYLLSLGVVKPRAVVEDDLVVVDASRRNSVFIATARSGPAYVVKQAGERSARTLAHEADVLRALAAAPELEGLVPEVVHEDREAARLVLRTPAGARDLATHHDAGRFPETSGARPRPGARGGARASDRRGGGTAARRRPAVGALAAPSLRTSCCST